MKRQMRYMGWFFLLLLTACATVVAPNGGPKDVTPPQIVSAKPTNYQLRFNTREIKISFDEFVKLNNVNEQLLITPSFKEQPEIKIKKKSILISFQDTLQANTTYTFNFGDAIQDYTEGNTLSNFSYVFSTGDYIDSAVLKGRVLDPQTMKGKEKVVVMLYLSDVDSLPLTVLPYYIARTDKEGNFSFANLKTASYKVFALEDKDGNYLYNLPNESIAFVDTLVAAVDSVVKPLDLFLFQEEMPEIKLNEKFALRYGLLQFVFNKPYRDIEVELLSKEYHRDSILLEEGVQKDSLICWLFRQPTDSIRLLIKDQGQVIDTVEIALKEKTKRKKDEKEVLGIKGSRIVDLNAAFGLSMDNPVLYFDTTQMIFTNLMDSTRVSSFEWRMDSVKKHFYMQPQWQASATYLVQLLPGAFTDIFGLTNDTLDFRFTTREEEYYSGIRLSLGYDNPEQTPYQCYLLNEKGAVVWEGSVDADRQVDLNFLSPGKYTLKALFDSNANGKWDTGNYQAGSQAERFVFYKEEIMLRSNWELEIDWQLPTKP